MVFYFDGVRHSTLWLAFGAALTVTSLAGLVCLWQGWALWPYLLPVFLAVFGWTLYDRGNRLFAAYERTLEQVGDAPEPDSLAEADAEADTEKAAYALLDAKGLLAKEKRHTTIRAVLDAARKDSGVNATTMPRYDVLRGYGVTRPMWSAATDDLHAAGYVVKYASDKTVLTYGGTLGKLYALACRPGFDIDRPAPEGWPDLWGGGNSEQ